MSTSCWLCVQWFHCVAFRMRWEVAEGVVARSASKRNQGMKGAGTGDVGGDTWIEALLFAKGDWSWFCGASPVRSGSPQCVMPQALAGDGFPMSPAGMQHLPPGRPISSGWLLPGKLQMKSWELLPLMAFYPAKCFVALFMTSSVMQEPVMKRLKASFYFCLQTPSHCRGFASSLAGWKLWLKLAFPWVVSLCCWHEH